MNKFLFSLAVVSVVGCTGTTGTTTPPLTGTDALRTITATGGVAGAKGKLRLTFVNALIADATVTVTSSNAAIANVATTLTAPKGSLVADFEYDAKVVGSAVLYATLGPDTRSASVTVVDKIRLTQISSVNALEVGATATVYAYFNVDPPTPVTVTFTSDAATVASVASTLVVTPFANTTPYAFDNTNRVTVTAVGAGSTTIHAKLDDATVDQPVTVVAKAKLQNISAYPLIVETGGVVNLNASIDALGALPTSVTYTSSNPAVVPSGTIVIPAGAAYGGPQLTTLSAGTTTIHGTLGSASFDVTLQVLAAPSILSLNFSNTLQVGQQSSLYVTFDVTASKTHPFTVTSSDPSVLAVVQSMNALLSQNSTAYVPVNVLKNGTSTLTVTYGSTTQTVTATVSDMPATTLQAYGSTLAIGATSTISVYGQASGTMAVTVSDPTVLQVPASVAFNNNANIPVTGLKAGRVDVTMSIMGQMVSVSTVVVDHASLSFGPSIAVGVSQKSSAQLSISAVPPPGSTVTFTTSNAAVVPAPAALPLVIGTQYYNVPIQGLSSGTAIVTATLGTQKQSAVVYVGSSSTSYPVLSSFYASAGRLQVGAASTMSIALSAAALSEVPMTVTYSTPGIIDLPTGSPVVGIGDQGTTFAWRALAEGATDVTVTREGVSMTVSVTVVKKPTLTLSVPSSLKVGQTEQGSLEVDCLLAAETSVALSSAMPSTASVSASTVTLAPGISGARVVFGVKGVAMGSTIITATLGSDMVTGAVNVAP